MKHYYPAYYDAFRCIAARCPDSCCQGWEVVIDSETERCYNTVQGAFGDRLRQAVYTDPDGDRIFRLADDRKCPFWGDDRLCEIYKVLGEERLCATCARFPRLTMDYSAFCEHSLALACPEAARLILTTDSAYASFDAITADSCDDYDPALMCFLLNARQEAATILTSDKPLSLRLNELLICTSQAQFSLSGSFAAQEEDPAALFEVLEYIDEQNKSRFVKAASAHPDLSSRERELTNLALYWLFRYFLGAIDSLDILSPVRFLITSVNTVANLAKDGDLITAAQLYSKEVEQSYENMEKLL